MGDGVDIRCGNCRYRRQFTLGVGMMYNSLLNVIGDIPPDLRRKVRRAIEEEGAKSEDFYESLFRCPECDRLENHLYFRVRLVDGGTLESDWRCKSCGSKLVEADIEKLSDLLCPRCGKKKLAVDETSVILWD